MTGRHIQVIAPGAALGPVAASVADVVVCADGGIRVALQAGRSADIVVGDLDSALESDLAAALAAGARIDRHPFDKDESDLELAMGEAITAGAGFITVHVADGGRLDHQLANLLVLASSRWRSARIDAWVGDDRLWVVHDHLRLPLADGDPVAIQAVAGDAVVTTTGLAFPLDADVLHPAQARGIANEVVDAPAEVRVAQGVVLVISARGQFAQAT